jgi:hypothetical protein
MKSVFVVQHLNILPSGEDDVKMIGVYATREDAIQAAWRLASQPGFCDFPSVVDPSVTDDTRGFYVEEYEIGKDHWQEGYATL